MKYKQAFTLSVLTGFLILAVCLPVADAVHDIETDTMRVIMDAGSVQILRAEHDIAVNQYGVSLEDGDEVMTGPDGKATVLLSMLSDIDEVIVAPSSRIRVLFRTPDSLTSLYQIQVVYGKIRARTMLNRAKQIRFDTDLVEVTADEGEFVLESRKYGTSVGTISGLTKMVYKANSQEYQIPPKAMMFVSPAKSVSPARVFVNELFIGVERSDEEKAAETY
jgi:hypothetical protein